MLSVATRLGGGLTDTARFTQTPSCSTDSALGGLLQGSGEDTLHLVLESLATAIKDTRIHQSAWHRADYFPDAGLGGLL